jgi:hypothetical protein
MMAIKKLITILLVTVILSSLLGMSVVLADPGILFQATLVSGDYGGGSAIPPTTGVVDTPEGVHFISTEANGRSNGLINWQIPPAQRTVFRTNGTVSLMFMADRETHVSGEIVGENYGFGQFNNGQSTFAAHSNRVTNGTPSDKSDDQIEIWWKSWHNNVWYNHGPVTLEYDQWYSIGFAWGGPEHNFETWVCGVLGAYDSQAGAVLPWGAAYLGTGSATNIGLGDNHQRGVDAYGSAAGVTFANIRIWDQYVANGDTQSCDAIEVDEFPDSEAELTLEMPDGSLVPVTLSGPTVVHVFFDDGFDEVDTEIVSLELTGSSPSVGPVSVNQSSLRRSVGEIEENQNATPGTLDLPPFGSQGFMADSFFDVFFEIEVGGQWYHNGVPAHMTAIIDNKPPGPGTTYESGPQRIELLDENDNPTGIFIVHGTHTPFPDDEEPPEPPIEVGGDIYSADKMALLAPWMALAAVITIGATIAVRRRRTQS